MLMFNELITAESLSLSLHLLPVYTLLSLFWWFPSVGAFRVKTVPLWPKFFQHATWLLSMLSLDHKMILRCVEDLHLSTLHYEQII